MIRVMKSRFVDEAIDIDYLRADGEDPIHPEQKGGLLKDKKRFRAKNITTGEKKGERHIDVAEETVNDAYQYVIEQIFGKDKKNVKKQLQAYGTSEKELKTALRDVIAYNSLLLNQKNRNIANKFLADLKKQKPFNEKGKLGVSATYGLAKEMLELLEPSEFEAMLNMIKNSDDLASDLKRLKSFKVFSEGPEKVFAIDPEEEDKFYNSQKSAIKGIATKVATKRKIKDKTSKAIGSVKDKAKGAWNALKGAGQFARGLLA